MKCKINNTSTLKPLPVLTSAKIYKTTKEEKKKYKKADLLILDEFTLNKNKTVIIGAKK